MWTRGMDYERFRQVYFSDAFSREFVCTANLTERSVREREMLPDGRKRVAYGIQAMYPVHHPAHRCRDRNLGSVQFVPDNVGPQAQNQRRRRCTTFDDELYLDALAVQSDAVIAVDAISLRN